MPYIFEPKSAFEENWSESEVKNALRAEASKSSHVVVAVDTYNQTLSSTNQTLRKGNAGIDHTGGVMIFNNNDDKAYTMQVGGIGEESTMSFQEEKSYCLPANPMSDRIQSVGYQSSVVRRLTPTECERLQGFPDGWTDGQADSHRYKQMGNAVAVPVVQWIIDRLVK